MPRTRSSLILGLAMAAALGALATAAAAQQQPAPLKVANIRGNIYWTQGGAGGNTGIIVGQTGVIVVDTKTTVDSSKEVQAEIAKITPKPVTRRLSRTATATMSTGWPVFPPGLTIIAQENCKKEMEASAGSRGAAPQDRLPTKTIAKDETMTIDGVRVRLLHWAPAHTSGDLIVYLPDQKIVFAGDLLVTNRPDTQHSRREARLGGRLDGKRQGHDRSRRRHLRHRPRRSDDQGRREEETGRTFKTSGTRSRRWPRKASLSMTSRRPWANPPRRPCRTRRATCPRPTLTEVMYNEVTKKS